eukprot:2876393-Pleurochrysis_carterae.AAC.1
MGRCASRPIRSEEQSKWQRAPEPSPNCRSPRAMLPMLPSDARAFQHNARRKNGNNKAPRPESTRKQQRKVASCEALVRPTARKTLSMNVGHESALAHVA